MPTMSFSLNFRRSEKITIQSLWPEGSKILIYPRGSKAICWDFFFEKSDLAFIGFFSDLVWVVTFQEFPNAAKVDGGARGEEEPCLPQFRPQIVAKLIGEAHLFLPLCRNCQPFLVRLMHYGEDRSCANSLFFSYFFILSYFPMRKFSRLICREQQWFSTWGSMQRFLPSQSC